MRDNAKEYRGMVKAVGYDSPSQKFKDIIAGKAVGATSSPTDAIGTGPS